jgi:T4 RNA ligase (RNA_lig_T4_1).
MVLNYTEEVQFNKRWDSITLASRGLILDTAGKIIARPLPKFFNMEELPSIPNEPYEVHEKLDGSLGILYWLDGQPAIATRGSFTSWQAEEATKVLHEKI